MSCGSEECIKVIIVGNCGVGKTCLLHRFVRCEFIDQYTKTIGAEFLEKDVFCGDSKIVVTLMLWDTAGQEMPDTLTQAYYSGSSVAVLVFSTVDHDSYTDLVKWKQKVEFVCGPIVMVLCQTKCDLFRESSVTNSEAMELAEKFQLPLFRVSSKSNFNVSQLFEFIAQQCLGAEEVKRSADSLYQLKDLGKEEGGSANHVKKNEYKNESSSRGPSDSGRAAGKVSATAAIPTDDCVASVPIVGFSSVKGSSQQKTRRPAKTSPGRTKPILPSKSKKGRKCVCTMF